MGATRSTLSSLRENNHLIRFVSREHIQPTDKQFWTQLLSFTFNNPPRSSYVYFILFFFHLFLFSFIYFFIFLFSYRNEAKTLEDSVVGLLTQLIENNLQSLNIGSLARVTLDRQTQLKSTQPQDPK